MPEAALEVAAVARRLGVATGTLRTWDRRYGLGPSEHEAGSRRRYTARDLARLEVMRALMLEGVTPAEAARAALARDLDGSAAVDAPDVIGTVPRGAARRPSGRSGGGRVVPLRTASPGARGLARAAMALDQSACTAAVEAHLRRHGVLLTWDQLVEPVLAGVAEHRLGTGAGDEVDAMLREAVEAALRTAVRAAVPPPGARPVLVAAHEHGSHRLPLVAATVALAERAVPARLLGPGLPSEAVVAAVARTGPAAVLLWSDGPAASEPPTVAELTAVRPRPAVVLGGPGYEHARWRPGLSWAEGLAETVETVTELVAPSR